MSDLGERVARVMGEQADFMHVFGPPHVASRDKVCGYCEVWIGAKKNPRYCPARLPDPENSWPDFGALLEWAAVKIGRAEVYAILFGDSEEAWADTVYEGDPWPLSRFRRAVTESIL